VSINAATIRAMEAAGIPEKQTLDVIEHATGARPDSVSTYLAIVEEAERDAAEFLRIRHSVLQRDGMRCTYCGKDGQGFPLQCDHVIPRSRGGKSTPANLVAACIYCNSSKRTRTPEEWRGE